MDHLYLEKIAWMLDDTRDQMPPTQQGLQRELELASWVDRWEKNLSKGKQIVDRL